MDNAANSELQNDEILALQSIYNTDELRIKHGPIISGKFKALLEFPYDSVQLLISDTSHIPKSLRHLAIQSEDKYSYHLKYLPPITLTFSLPASYPLESAPSCSLSCPWLGEEVLEQIRSKLLEEWEEINDVILFTWASFLIDQSWELTGLTDCIRVSEDISSDLVGQLCTFDYDHRLYSFRKTTHSCSVCFEEHIGSLCLEFLPCCHVFCKPCMKGFFEVMISEGSVSGILCPADECESSALPHQVQELVEPALFERYERFLLQRSLDQMEDVYKCPRKLCENFVLKDTDTNLGNCTECGLVFCVLCERSWHGVNKCEVLSAKYMEIYKIYQEGDQMRRLKLYKQYGRARIEDIVANIQSYKWLEENSKECPECGAMIQLGTGCNKVQCTVCNGYMCWLCGEKLPKSSPYSHFGSGGTCHGKLFQGTREEWHDDDEDDGFDIYFDEFEALHIVDG